MAGVFGGDYKDRIADRLLRSIGKCSDFELYSVVDRKPVEITQSLIFISDEIATIIWLICTLYCVSFLVCLRVHSLYLCDVSCMMYHYYFTLPKTYHSFYHSTKGGDELVEFYIAIDA